MPLDWMDVSGLSFNTLLLLERVQLSWLPASSVPRKEMGIALRANPAVAWYLRKKCPEINGYVDAALAEVGVDTLPARMVRAAEVMVLRWINDWVIYAVDPSVYDAQPFLNWDSWELTSLVDFTNKVVIDVGSGTGRLAFTALEAGARAVYAVEPVGNLRLYMLEKAERKGLKGLYAVDGLITAIPFEKGFADVTMSGHVFGDEPERELAELERVTAWGGMVILCPGTSDVRSADPAHSHLIGADYAWGRFEEPHDGWKRKYWKGR